MRLAGRVASITGAGGGIGRSAAQLSAREGARVLVSDIDIEAAKRTGDAVRDVGGVAHVVQADVSDTAQVERLYAEGEDVFGKVDVLLNNAGIFDRADGSVTDTDEDTWDRVIDVDPQRCVPGVRPQQHPRECAVSGTGRDAAARGIALGPTTATATARPHPDGSLRPRGRDSQGGAVPGVR